MSAWTEHVTAALLGTRRRPVPPLAGVPPLTGAAPSGAPPLLGPAWCAPSADEPWGSAAPGHTGESRLPATPSPGGDARPAGALQGGDPAGRLLDQAAVLTVCRRAGRLPETAEPVAPAPVETTRPVPAAAMRRLRRILSGEQARLLPEWLDAAARNGHHAPPSLLPELLDRGRADRALRPSLARAAGRRGVWLAMRNVDWAYLVVTGGDEAAADPAVWETGVRAQRVGHLTRLRATDPAAARTTLRRTWAREPATDRAAFVATFERNLSSADEEFLEAALDDRGVDVRRIAADLLARLPASAYGRRMAERARACVRPAGGGRRGWIVADPPREHDEAMLRDGIPFHAPAGVGNRAGRLREIIGRTPLSTWTELFGAEPEEIVRLPIAAAHATRPSTGGPAGAAVSAAHSPVPAAATGSAGPASGPGMVDPASPTQPAGPVDPLSPVRPASPTDPARPVDPRIPGGADSTAAARSTATAGSTATVGGPAGAAPPAGEDAATKTMPAGAGVADDAVPAGDPNATEDVHQGWAVAAVRQRDAAWAAALLVPRAVAGDTSTLAGLLDALPDAERDRAAATAIRPMWGRAALLDVLRQVPGPWRGALADAVVEIIASVADGDGPGAALVQEMSATIGSPGGHPAGDDAEAARDRVLAPLCRLAGEHLAPNASPRLASLARRYPGSAPLAELAEALRFRHEMHEELR